MTVAAPARWWSRWPGRLGAASACLLAAIAVHAQPKGATTPLTVLPLRAQQLMHLDGRLDEPWWADAPLLDRFVETDPGDRLPPPVRTEVRFATDGRYLYIGVQAHDPDLSALRAPLTRRDDAGDDVDKVTIWIDSMGLRRYAQLFEVTPSGGIGDGLFSEASGSADHADTQLGTEDRSPNYRFRSAVGRFDGGWSFELAIPFSSLRYDARAGRPWTVLVGRNYPREQATYMLSAPIGRDYTCTLCLATGLVGVQPAAGALALQGTATLSLHHERERGAADTAAGGQRDAELGVDLKWRPRADTDVDLTLKPDFSQVEIDAPQLASNTRYAIYYPEKRPFFLEGADILESPLPVLRTRSLGRPDGGVRLTLRDTLDGTFAIVRDGAGGELLLPGPTQTDSRVRPRRSTALLGRVRLHRDALSLGAVFSERRHGEELGDNTVAGVDLAWRLAAGERVDLQWLSSRSSALQAERGVPDSGQAWQARWYHRDAALHVDTSVRHIDVGFRADNGFFERAGLRQTHLEVSHPQRDLGFVHEAGVYGQIDRDTALQDDSLVMSHRHIGVYANLPLLTKVWFEPVVEEEQRPELGALSHRTRRWHLGLTSVPGATWSGVYLDVRRGRMLDVQGARTGPGKAIEAWSKWQLLRSMQLQLEAQRLAIHGDDGTSWLRESTARVLVLWHLSQDQYLRWIDQRQRVVRRAGDGRIEEQEHEVARTLSWQLRLAGAWQLDIGVSARRVSRLQPADGSSVREGFVKLAYEFDR